MRGFIAGGLVGMAAGMLILPQMDSKTRRRLLNKGADMVQSASHMMPGMGK